MARQGEGEIIIKACMKANMSGPSPSLLGWGRGSVCSKEGQNHKIAHRHPQNGPENGWPVTWVTTDSSDRRHQPWHRNFFLKNAPLLNLWKWKAANTFSQTVFMLQITTPGHPFCTYQQLCTYKKQAGVRSWSSVHLQSKCSWVELRLQTSPWTLHLNS